MTNQEIAARASAELSEILYEEECNRGWITDECFKYYKGRIKALKFAIKVLDKMSKEKTL